MSDEAKNDFMNNMIDQTYVSSKFSSKQKIAYLSRQAKLIGHLSVKQNLMLANKELCDETLFEKQYKLMLNEINYPAIKDLLPSQLTDKQLLLIELAVQVVRKTNVIIFDMDVPKMHMIFQDKSVASFIDNRFRESVKVTLHQHDFTMFDTSIKLNFSKDGLKYE